MWRIRKLVPGDVPGVLLLQSSCPEIAQWTAADYEQVAGGDMAGWVAEDDDGIAGFLVARTLGRETEILNIAVRPDARRRGVGSNLLTEAVVWSTGLRAETVLLEVRESNTLATRFYERHGFRVAGRRRGYYATPAEDALLLDLPL